MNTPEMLCGALVLGMALTGRAGLSAQRPLLEDAEIESLTVPNIHRMVVEIDAQTPLSPNGRPVALIEMFLSTNDVVVLESLPTDASVTVLRPYWASGDLPSFEVIESFDAYAKSGRFRAPRSGQYLVAVEPDLRDTFQGELLIELISGNAGPRPLAPEVLSPAGLGVYGFHPAYDREIAVTIGRSTAATRWGSPGLHLPLSPEVPVDLDARKGDRLHLRLADGGPLSLYRLEQGQLSHLQEAAADLSFVVPDDSRYFVLLQHDGASATRLWDRTSERTLHVRRARRSVRGPQHANVRIVAAGELETIGFSRVERVTVDEALSEDSPIGFCQPGRPYAMYTFRFTRSGRIRVVGGESGAAGRFHLFRVDSTEYRDGRPALERRETTQAWNQLLTAPVDEGVYVLVLEGEDRDSFGPFSFSAYYTQNGATTEMKSGRLPADRYDDPRLVSDCR